MRKERGISDVIGFTLVFGLIISSIALVSVTAFASIQDAREQQQRQNSLRAFVVFDDNVQEVANGDTEARETEIRATDAQVYYGDPVTIEALYSPDADFTDSDNTELSTGRPTEPVVYRTAANQKIVYVNGGIIQQVDGGSTFYQDPAVFSTQNDRLYLSFIRVEPIDGTPAGVGGGTRVLYTTSPDIQEQTLNKPNSNGYIEYTVSNTENTQAWADWCRDGPLEATSVSVTGDDVTCQSKEFDGFYSHRSEIRMSIA